MFPDSRIAVDDPPAKLLGFPVEKDAEQGSDDYWLLKLSKQIRDDYPELEAKHQRFVGNGPLPEDAHPARAAYAAFQRKARTNVERLIVAAVLQRMKVLGFRTAVSAQSSDDGGDSVMLRQWTALGMKVILRDALKMMLSLGRSYLITGFDPDDATVPVVTAEDPREVTHYADPATGKLGPVLKLYYDDVAGEDVAYLYRRGSVRTARSARKRRIGNHSPVAVTATTWLWDTAAAVPLPGAMADRHPVCLLENEDGLAEFEAHIDLIDRLDHQVLQLMTIATMQAFRQRAVSGLPEKDEQGQVIDYEGVFRADPAALWQLPETAKMWESGQVDLTPILNAQKETFRTISAVTFTPLYYIAPDQTNGSAEGASLQREGADSKAEDRVDRAEVPIAKTAENIAAIIGDEQRATPGSIHVIWAPIQRYSLSERAAAAAQAGDVPWRTKMTSIWGFTPDEVDRMQVEREADMLFARRAAAAQAAATARIAAASAPQQPTAAPPTDPNAPADAAAEPAAAAG